MKNWSHKFNKLPKETRRIFSAMELQTRIGQMKIDKDRIKNAYNNALSKINNHIKCCKEDLAKLED